MNSPPTASNSLDFEFQGLEADSYTATRLKDASAEHLRYTTRRCFIGPIPDGWLKSHRKEWYKQKLGIGDYSSRRATFTASSKISHQKQLTGLEGPSAGAIFGHSFPQPPDLDEEGGDTSQEQSDAGETAEIAPVNTEDAAGEESRQDEVDQDREGTQASADEGERQHVGGSEGEDLLKPSPRHVRTGKSASSSRPKESFVTAKERQRSPQGASRVPAASSDLRDDSATRPSIRVEDGSDMPTDRRRRVSLDEGSPSRSSGPIGDTTSLPAEANSTISLIPRKGTSEAKAGASYSMKGPLQHQDPEANVDEDDGYDPSQVKKRGITFNLTENVTNQQDKMGARLKRVQSRTRSNRFRRNKLRDGEIVKIEKMLVRVDSTLQTLPPDYNENHSLKTESTTVEKWREFVVVCRQTEDEDGDFILQMYKSRVIPEVEKKDVKKRSTYDILLQRNTTRVNLYSSLDKTVVIWHPYRNKTRIYIIRPRSSAHSVEWYTFLRDVLGWTRPSTVQINIPDLSVALRIEKPFEQLEASRDAIQKPDRDDAALMRTMVEEQAVARRLVNRCMTMLEDSPEWANVLDSWSKSEKMGLAWKRYDRLEWVYGTNEQKMYGTMAMLKSHDLELRPKQHYPTKVESRDGGTLREPPPVEGFLIRLTSQRGVHQRLGKMFFKRLYFSTHNQFLCFCRPSKASPPAPPKLTSKRGSSIPSRSEIIDQIPLILSINPFPVQDGEVSWLKSGNRDHIARHNQEADNENQRNAQIVSNSDGYINMCKVVEVRSIVRGASPADPNIDEGPDVEFHQDVQDSHHDDGSTDQIDDIRTFELRLNNGLVIRLQAYNEEAKKEWMKQLEGLAHYWKLRIAADMALFKMIRRVNLETLNIDEEMEATLGQFAEKWEVARSAASPQLYHMCGISCCRSILMSGVLYRKPRRHSTFLRCGVILCNGKLLIFQGSLRKRTGEEVPHIHSELVTAIDLADCYLYSGLLTDSDLLYQNQTFDSNHPGHHALPRVYLEDGWTSSDEDTTTCFVIWHALQRGWFRANEEKEDGGKRQRLKRLSKLGVPGRSIVFKTRSRAERDHWVMSIGMEIDRLQQGEDVRLVPNN